MPLTVHEHSLANKKIIIFGTGAFSNLLHQSPVAISYYVDNNSSKWGTFHNGLPVVSPEKLRDENKEEMLVIIASMYDDEISRQLAGFGFQRNIHFISGVDALQVLFAELFARLQAFKDIHRGERAFIIGNGPSLTIHDLNRLRDEITFASNKIFLAFEETDWRPNYYTVFDGLVAENCKKEIQSKINGPKFFPIYLKPIIGDMDETYWLNQKTELDERGAHHVQSFSNDVSEVIVNGASVTYFNLQLAYYMGIREIFLLGVDFFYPGVPEMTPDRSFYIHQTEHTRTHFHPGYNQVGEKNNIPDQVTQYQAFSVAAAFLQNNNARVFNCSRQTKLDVFPIVNFDDVL